MQLALNTAMARSAMDIISADEANILARAQTEARVVDLLCGFRLCRLRLAHLRTHPRNRIADCHHIVLVFLARKSAESSSQRSPQVQLQLADSGEPESSEQGLHVGVTATETTEQRLGIGSIPLA